MRRSLALLSLIAVTVGLTVAPASASPLNDTFSSPIVLSGTHVTRSGDSNVGATSEPGEPQHANRAGGASIWYSWTPSVNGPATLSTAGSSFDTLLGVYIGATVNGLAGVTSNDDDPNHPVLTSVVHFDAVGGTTYRIAVDGYAGDQGTLQLKLVEGPPSTTRVSISDLEGEANDDSQTATYDDNGTPSSTTALSTSGGVVAFASDATNLIQPTADGNGCTDVFVRNPGGGTTQRVSISDLEAQGNDCSYDPTVSGDGNFVAFSSDATNLIQPTADGNGCTDVFVRNVSGATTQRVSLTNAGAQANDCSNNPALSSDGNVVAFESWATNLVAPSPNGNMHIFVRNLSGASTTQVTKTSGGTQANNDSFDPALSADGRYVAYESRATNLGIVDTNGARDIYMTDTSNGAITRISEGTGGVQGDNGAGSFNPSISGDGRYVAFESDATSFASSDTNNATDVFVHDNTLGTTTRVSVRTNGTQAKDNSYDPQISSDGRYVVFTSDAPNLVSNDANGASDVFLHDNTTGITTRLSVDSAGNEGGASSSFPSISGDGTQSAFTSDADNLVAGDTLGNTDVFERPVSYQGDLLVKRSTSGGYTGDGVYESTATTQVLPVVKVKRGAASTFNLRLQNDGSVDDTLALTGCAKSKGFAVAYRSGGADVTTAVTTGAYRTGALAPDDIKSVDLTVTVAPTAKVNALQTCSMALVSQSDAPKVDAVATQIKVAK
jgi:Tol biopolymer transport system component